MSDDELRRNSDVLANPATVELCMAIDGHVAMQRQGTIAGRVFGVPSVEISTIAAVGGSIAEWMMAE
ncbi:hypothetical protein EFQ99_29545 [Rhizobium vallis]|uniref:Uncharacterized protein n=1 Tax=Rhizobium vallis TaxID=634290 RepID=A0A432PDA4_9HYPH|nr:hypothetical protein EFQ99_29545 [Rhizobium vallis]